MNDTDITRARVVYYGLFAALFSFTFGEEEYAVARRAVDVLGTNPVDEHRVKKRLPTSGAGWTRVASMP